MLAASICFEQQMIDLGQIDILRFKYGDPSLKTANLLPAPKDHPAPLIAPGLSDWLFDPGTADEVKRRLGYTEPPEDA